MIFCKNCGYEGEYLGRICPVCNREIELDREDMEALRADVEEAKSRKELETAAEGYHILADFGDVEGAREYARMLEKGNGVERNIDRAMDYFRRAADGFDAYSAYRYGELISRMNADAAGFWIEFSAMLGASEAYLDVARKYSEEGENALANHYLYLGAMEDDVDAIVTLAERYYTGTGIEQSSAYAKWYMDKLNFPPLYALKLAIKLRSQQSSEAPNIALKDPTVVARRLLGLARRLELKNQIFYLTGILFDHGDIERGAELGEMYLAGIGCERDTTAAIRALSRAAATGSAAAYLLLGRIHCDGTVGEPSPATALDYFKKAAELGSAEAYELIGDLYHDSSLVDRDVAYAEEVYSKAALLGSASAAEKAERIRRIRLDYYRRSEDLWESDGEEAFRLCYIANAMGHTRAKLALAEAFALGHGVKRDPKEAFYYYTAAKEAGCDEAYFPLGVCYALGFGTAFSFESAIKHFTLADKLGDVRARGEIIRLYENKKKRLARKLYSAAMRLIYSGKFSVAEKYLRIAYDFGHAKGIYTLGCLCEFDRSTTPGRDNAYELYKKSESLGFTDERSVYKLKVLKLIKRN